MKTKEERIKYIESFGYKNLNDFSEECGIHRANIDKNVDGKQRPGIKRCFAYANALHVPIVDVLDMFYEDEMEENRRHARHPLRI